MKYYTLRTLLIAAAMLIPFCLNAAIENKSSGKSDGFTITIPGKQQADGKHFPSKIYKIEKLSPENYLSNTIYIKTKTSDAFDKFSSRFTKSIINNEIQDLGIEKIEAPFAAYAENSLLSSDPHGIKRIHRVKYSAPVDPYDVCRELSKNPEIEYAVPIFRRDVYDYTPNDPRFGNQDYLNHMDVRKAWDITQGSKDIVIAIVDSGTDWNHEDLKDQIWTNPNEIPDDGIDNDGNGKVDDVRGWDFVGNVTGNQLQQGNFQEDNDPANMTQFHGTHVAGCAAATTDNNVGIASPAFNCSILPVKCASDNGSAGGIWRGYEAVLYAARLGADVINCSWGGPGSSPAEQDVINSAVEMGSVVVAASGNDGQNIDDGGQFPAGYANVLVVGASRQNDDFAYFSNYGHKVTVYAPGEAILSTMPNDGYSNQQGTSMASPIAAGIAALVKSVHPDWSPIQILHQLRSTSDDVLADNESVRPFVYGRANAYKAVTFNNTNVSQEVIPGVSARNIRFASGSAITDYQPMKITIEVTNYLSNVEGLNLKLTPLDNYIRVTQTELAVGDLVNMQSKDVDLEVQLLPNNPWFKGYADVLMTYESDGYTDYQLLKIPIDIQSNNDYQRITSFPTGLYLQFHAGMAPDMNTYWTVGESPYYGGAVYRYGGGNYFNKVSDNPLYCVEAIGSKDAWVGDGPQDGNASVYYTTNSGQQWFAESVSDITGFINEIYFFDGDNGLFLGDPKNNRWGVGATTDGGESWSRVISMPMPQNNETGLVGATWRHGDYVWFGTTRGRMFRSTDRGLNWEESDVHPGGFLTGVCFMDEEKGVAVYRNSQDENEPLRLAASTDGGATWQADQYNFTENEMLPVSMYAPPKTGQIIFLDVSGAHYSSSDLGQTFEPVLSEQKGIKTTGDGINSDYTVRFFSSGPEVSYLEFDVEPFEAIRKLEITSGETVDYDSVDVGASSTEKVTMENEGNVTIYIEKIEIVPGADTEPGEFSIGFLKPDEVAAGAEEKLMIKFKPESKGPKTAELVITSDADESVKSVALFGIGRIPVSVSADDAPQDINIGHVSPNPAAGRAFINIRSHSPQNMTINVYNSAGENVWQAFEGTISGSKRIIIPAESFASGTYYVIIHTNSGNYFRSFGVIK